MRIINNNYLISGFKIFNRPFVLKKKQGASK